MTKDIDIIVTYVDNSDKSWRKEFIKYFKKEKESGNTNLDDFDFNGENRYRDWDTFKYFFRGVEKNCPWVRKVFLVVASESQVPKWINKECSKLQIVYHRDYIPQEFLPTFNSNVIEMFFYKIKDLSDHYILCNDDTFFLNPVPETYFFLNDKVVLGSSSIRTGRYSNDSLYRRTLNNNADIESKYFSKRGLREILFTHKHVQLPHIKSFDSWVWEQEDEAIYNSLIISRFRNEKNLTHFLFNDMLQIYNRAVYYPQVYHKAICINLRREVDFNKFSDYELVCFNDSGVTSNFEQSKSDLILFLESKMPNKSEFEY